MCHTPHGRPFPTALEPLYINRYEVRAFAEEAYKSGIKYLGLCCGNTPAFTREVAEVMDKPCPASKYQEQMNKHFMYGDDTAVRKTQQGFREKI